MAFISDGLAALVVRNHEGSERVLQAHREPCCRHRNPWGHAREAVVWNLEKHDDVRGAAALLQIGDRRGTIISENAALIREGRVGPRIVRGIETDARDADKMGRRRGTRRCPER